MRTSILWAVGIGTSVSGAVACAQLSGGPNGRSAPVSAGAFGAPRDPYAWTAEEWTGNDVPYRQLRARIDKAIAGRQNPDALVAKYQALAQEQPSDPQAQFAWGYAAWSALKPSMSSHEHRVRLEKIRRAFARVPSPRTYEYARLRFLVEARAARRAQLRSVGERLVRRAPNDYDIKYQLAGVLNIERSAERKRQALSCVQDLVRLNPKDARAYSQLGEIHLVSWMATRSREDGDKAIAAYREYLRLAPANYQWRKQAERIIQVIQRDRAKAHGRGL